MFELGQLVKVNAIVSVTKIWNRGDRGTSRILTAVPEQHTGVFVGYRTSPEGWTENMGEDGLCFHQTGHKRLALVAISKWRIVRAFITDVEPRRIPPPSWCPKREEASR